MFSVNVAVFFRVSICIYDDKIKKLKYLVFRRYLVRLVFRIYKLTFVVVGNNII